MPRPAKLKRIDLVGQRFGKLLIISRGENRPGQHSRWNYVCDCGATGSAKSCHLRSGATQSCGCGAGKTHGASGGRKQKTPEYHSWLAAKQRCFNPNNIAYRYYGGRGIGMCDRWKDSFAAFLADMGSRPEGMSLDRIDSDGHYEPGNCRWATRTTQSANQRRPRKLAAAGSPPTRETANADDPSQPDHTES